MRNILSAMVIFTAISCSQAFAEVSAYTLVKEKSSLKFFAIQNSAPLEGKFGEYSATIRFDPEQTDKSTIEVTVDTGSVLVADEQVLTHLKAPEWLSVVEFPKAVFKSTQITRMPFSDNYIVDGDLTIRDKTVPVTLNFKLKSIDSRAIAEGYATLRRNAFNIGQGEWSRDDVIKNEVRVEFRIVADKK